MRLSWSKVMVVRRRLRHRLATSRPVSVHRESAREAECIEHIFSATESRYFATILALVQKETSLLPFQDVCFEFQAGFEKDYRTFGWVSNESRRIGNGNSFSSGFDIPAQTQHESLRSQFANEVDDFMQKLEPDRRIQLQNQSVGVLVEH